MDAPVIIDNRLGSVRGYVQKDQLTLFVSADTPKHGPFSTAFRLGGVGKLNYLHAVMQNLEMQFFSLIATRGQRSGFTMLADLGQDPPLAAAPVSANGGHGYEHETADAIRQLPQGVGPEMAPRPEEGSGTGNGHGPRTVYARGVRRAALFEGELCNFRTQSEGGRAGVEIRSKFDTGSLRYRVFFSVLNFQTRAVARFDMNIGEIRAVKTLAETALGSYERLEVVLLDDVNTLTARLRLDGPGMDFSLHTPYTDKRIRFQDAHNLATLAFWCERALAHRGNPLIAFKRDHLGMSLWEHPETLLPYARFHLGGQDAEILNLTRLNLCSIKLFADLALRRSVVREPEEPNEPAPAAEAAAAAVA